ncbi:MAG: glycine cleavage system protein GcvH [Nitrospirae bacterium]|nr:glycine cleavage system protein GcvH [Nitrospirota bacterium]
MNPDDLLYHKEHAWARISGKRATVGITDYAQESLGEVVYIELPETGATVQEGDDLGEIESTKATSSIISPVSGKVVEINEELNDAPETVNENPYGSGWIAVLELEDNADTSALLSAEAYTKFVQEESK